MAKVTTTLAGDLALLPLQPKAPVKEVLEWLTDVQTSRNGTEMRLELRVYPRQTFSYTVPEQAWQKNAGFNVQFGALSEDWAVPIWTESQYIGAVSVADTLNCVTDVYDFRDTSLALLWQAPDKWQVIEIVTVGDGVLNLLEDTEVFTGAYLMPLRIGHVVNAIGRRATGHNVETQVIFEIDDNTAFQIELPDQFLDDDLYFTVPLLDGDKLDYDLQTRIDTVDFELGLIARRAPWKYNRVVRAFNVLCETPQEVRNFKGWLMRRAGRYRQFWEPSFENDFQKQSTGTVNSAILVAKDGIFDWDQIADRAHIGIELDNGWEVRTVTSITNVGAQQVQLNLDTSLGGVNATRIKRISWLGLKRLNSDQCEMNWIGNGVMQATVPVIEIAP